MNATVCASSSLAAITPAGAKATPHPPLRGLRSSRRWPTQHTKLRLRGTAAFPLGFAATRSSVRRLRTRRDQRASASPRFSLASTRALTACLSSDKILQTFGTHPPRTPSTGSAALATTTQPLVAGDLTAASNAVQPHGRRERGGRTLLLTDNSPGLRSLQLTTPVVALHSSAGGRARDPLVAEAQARSRTAVERQGIVRLRGGTAEIGRTCEPRSSPRAHCCAYATRRRCP